MEEEKKLVYDNSPVEETPRKPMPKFIKIPVIVLSSLVGFFVVVWAGLNTLKFPIYMNFYRHKKDICNIPGLNLEPTAQGCTYDSETDSIYTTAYTHGKAATVYSVTKNNGTLTHKLYQNGAEFCGHVGGIATSGEYAFIASEDHVFTVKTADLLNDQITNIDIGNGILTHNQASFVFSNDTYLYVGEFHDGGAYVTNNIYKDNHAIVEKYDVNDFTPTATEANPLQVISIRNKVQGFCVTSQGTYVMSTSYGLADSYFYMYSKDNLVKTDQQMHGADLYEFTEVTSAMKAPAMMEDLDIYKDGTVMTLTESGSNKYVFGKFFFATHIISLNIK